MKLIIIAVLIAGFVFYNFLCKKLREVWDAIDESFENRD